mmetsp:Transcript_14600/g.42803  ORF Transcript_14600/g.42803 Transcript_14600/m.42803 type:complete len:228 (+) Transcript_14600:975-1658(+)
MVYGSSLTLWSEGTSMDVTRPLTHSAPYSKARSRRYLSRISRRHMPMYSLGLRVSPMSTSFPVGEMRFILRTLRSTVLSGMSNSPTMHSGMAPPHGLALSSLRSKRTVSIPFSCAKISAAQAPEGPPPTTATLYFMHRAEEEAAEWATGAVRTNEDGEKADAPAARVARAKPVNFILVVGWGFVEVAPFAWWAEKDCEHIRRCSCSSEETNPSKALGRRKMKEKIKR